jgi:hypothetical protein
LWGARLTASGGNPASGPAGFDTAVVSFDWQKIEATEGKYSWEACDALTGWCREHKLKVAGGPLLQLDGRGLPDWLYLWEGDFDNLFSVVSDYVETLITRYAGKVDLWICAARLAELRALSLSEEEKLRLAVRTVELARQVDPSTPAIICFDQPWGEYLSHAQADFPPIHLADALVRAGLGLSGLGLELNVGYQPRGTAHRGPVEMSRLIDRWSIFGLPLYLFVTCPSSSEEDPHAQLQTRPVDDAWPGGWSPEAQHQWIDRFLPLLLAKPAVRGVFWNQWRDDQPHDFPHGGLIDGAGRAKPALRAMAALRKRCLG